jgi:hypothetical protein
MRKLSLSLMLASFVAVSVASLANADTFQFVRRSRQWTYTDAVYWNTLPINSSIASGTTVHSKGNIGTTITFGLGGAGETYTQCGSSCGSRQDWSGNFLPGEHLLSNWSGTNEGNLILTFSQAIEGLGFSIESDTFGTFEAEITLFDGSTDLGSFFRKGSSSFAPGSIESFLGVSDLTGADITSARISAFDCNGGPCSDGFAISYLALQTKSTTTTPEPAGLALVGSGVLALGFLLRRKLARQN